MASYKLYNRVGSGGMVVEAALALTGADYELAEIESKPGSALPDSFRTVNPWRQVPTLILPDGSTMTETSAILIHLAACFPEKALGPAPGTPAHAAFLRWIIFANVNVYEAVLRRVYPERYCGDDPAAADATRDAAIVRAGEALAVLEQAATPGPFLLGEAMSLADVYVAMLLAWHRGEIAAPHLARLMTAVRTHPVVAPIWTRHFADRHKNVRLTLA